jgi:hypothetical protein
MSEMTLGGTKSYASRDTANNAIRTGWSTDCANWSVLVMSISAPRSRTSLPTGSRHTVNI